MDMRKLTPAEEQICDNLGYLFSKSGSMFHFDSKDFVEKWMTGRIGEEYDHDIHWTHGMGEGYMFEYLEDVSGPIKKATDFFPEGVLYWIGYMYRFLVASLGKSSKEIYAMFNVDDMEKFYDLFDGGGGPAAIAEEMLDIYRERQVKTQEPSCRP